MARHKIISMLHNADFYSNFISTHQQGTQQLVDFLRDLNLQLCPSMAWMAHPPTALEGTGMWGEQSVPVSVSLCLSLGSPGATEQEWCELEPLHSSGAGQLPAHPAVCLYHVLTMLLRAFSKSSSENLCRSLSHGLFCILIPSWSHGAARKILFAKSELM